LALAFWITRTLLLYLNIGTSSGTGLQVSLDPIVAGFSIALTVLTALLFGLVPAWQSSKPDVVAELKGIASYGRRADLRRFLVAMEIAFSIVILFAASLLTRTLSHLKAIDLGFNPESVITLRIDPRMNGHSADSGEHVFEEILSRLRAQPRTKAALAQITPLEGGMMAWDLDVPGHINSAMDVQTNANIIGSGYFDTLDQKILMGRDFNEHDLMESAPVVIVNELFVRQYMPNQNSIGRHFKMLGKDREIVGLVANSHYQFLREKPGPLIYIPAAQVVSSGYTLLVRTNLPVKQAAIDIREAVHSVDPKLPIYDLRTMQDVVDRSMTSERLLAFLSSLFSALATILCSMGVYGMIAYAVTRRTREVGVRMAIGAQKLDVAKLFLRESATLVLVGIAVGLPLAIASTSLLKNLLFGIEPTDPWTLAFAAAIFIAVGVLASFLPVRKATRIEPVEALRYE
jgi:predicted permease